MIRHSAFPNVPANEPVGPLAGRRFMESFNDTTLRGMARGWAGEPSHVVSLAKSILRNRGESAVTAKSDYPPSVKTPQQHAQFDNWVDQAQSSTSKAMRHSAIVLLQNTFGYNFHKEGSR